MNGCSFNNIEKSVKNISTSQCHLRQDLSISYIYIYIYTHTHMCMIVRVCVRAYVWLGVGVSIPTCFDAAYISAEKGLVL